MNKLYSRAALPILVLFSTQAYALPAFPGAEGFGSDTPGGRFGKVMVVTNLKDWGSGSFRDAVESRGPRIVVFKVAGTITLTKPLEVHNPNITIAGQTAPGGGITVRGYTFRIDTQDVIVRHMRFRLGNETRVEDDAIGIRNGARNVVLDHVSASWSTDEALSPSGYIKDITVQWCFITESLNKSVHIKGTHGYGSLLRAVGGVTLHHNLWAFNNGRNPRFGDNYLKGDGTPTFDFRNNVIYGWGEYASGLVDGNIEVNYVDNYLKAANWSARIEPITLTVNAGKNTRFYVRGNVVEGDVALTADNTKFVGASLAKEMPQWSIVDHPFAAPPVTTQAPAEVFSRVLASGGATLPLRDSVDQRVSKAVLAGLGRIIDSQEEVGGWPELAAGTPILDSDGDGMPDEWELTHKLDPKSADDANKLSSSGSGYTNIEEYINSLTEVAAQK